jgi:hypothetical protein
MSLKEKLLLRIAWSLPRGLVYWCAVRVGAHACYGQFASQIVPDLPFLTVLQRWLAPHKAQHRPLTRFIH